MPTEPLSLLHALLSALDIPVHPRSLSSVSPSLLLLILETLIDTRLGLSEEARSCQTFADEVAVVKCVLGVLADDLLGIDLGIIRPRDVVRGSEQQLAILIMAFAVLAKRSGIPLVVRDRERTTSREESLDWSIELADMPTMPQLPEPLSPDSSFSPVLTSSARFADQRYDVFGDTLRYDKGRRSDSDGYTAPSLQHKEEPSMNDSRLAPRKSQDHPRRESSPPSGRTSAHPKTILENIMDEFGLGTGS